jgi:hypothetical protein
LLLLLLLLLLPLPLCKSDLYGSIGPKPRMNPDLEVLSQLFPHQQVGLTSCYFSVSLLTSALSS